LSNGGTGNTSSSGSSGSSSTDPSAVDVPINLDKLKFTYTKSADGSNNIITTDSVRLKSFYYNGLGLTNITQEQFSDLSDVSFNTLSTGKLVKWNGTYFEDTELLYDDETTGYIGIGTSTPSFPLTVTSFTSTDISNIGYLDQSGAAVRASETTNNISIYASKGIWTGTSFYASSDLRIKKNITPILNEKCIDIIRQLVPKKYSFVDDIQHGDREVYGFIAQEVEQVCPNIVTKQTSFVPDIFKSTENVSWKKVDKKWMLTIHDISGFKERHVVRFYVSDRKNNEIMKDVSNCKNSPNSFIFDKIYDDIFVYGHKVNDFLALDKEQIFTLHHGALLSLDDTQQRICDEIKLLKKDNVLIREENITLRSENNMLRKEHNTLKEEFQQVLQQLKEIKAHLGI